LKFAHKIPTLRIESHPIIHVSKLAKENFQIQVEEIRNQCLQDPIELQFLKFWVVDDDSHEKQKEI